MHAHLLRTVHTWWYSTRLLQQQVKHYVACIAWSFAVFFSGWGVMSFHALNTHHLFGCHCCQPKSALLWKLSRWLLHNQTHLPVALAKPMLTVGLFHSLILKSCFGPPPTQQNTPRHHPTWSGHAATVGGGLCLGVHSLKVFNFRYFYHVVIWLVLIISATYSWGMSPQQLNLENGV